MSSSIKIESVVKEKNRMGECPVWEERENALVYVDINSQKVCRWSPVTNEVQSVSVGESILTASFWESSPSVPSTPPGRSPAGWRSLLLSMGPVFPQCVAEHSVA